MIFECGKLKEILKQLKKEQKLSKKEPHVNLHLLQNLINDCKVLINRFRKDTHPTHQEVEDLVNQATDLYSCNLFSWSSNIMKKTNLSELDNMINLYKRVHLKKEQNDK